jgi:hypothetical protein
MPDKNAREVFKEMLSICYDEDYPQLHEELVSLDSITKRDKSKNKYETAIKELLNIIPLFAEDFSPEIMLKLENIYEDFLES